MAPEARQRIDIGTGDGRAHTDGSDGERDMGFDKTVLEAAHEHCFGNEPEIRASQQACCIACAKPFWARLATEGIEQSGRDHLTLCCPVCGFDSVIGDQSGYPVDDGAFMAAMNRQYFKEPVGSDGAWKELLDASN